MQINSVSNGYGIKFGALSPELQENMWQAIKRNRPQGYQNINKSKLYQDYKYILNNTSGDNRFFVESRTDYNKGRIIEQKPFSDDKGKGFELIRTWDISKAYSKKDPYKEIIKIFAQGLRKDKANNTPHSLSVDDIVAAVSVPDEKKHDDVLE